MPHSIASYIDHAVLHPTQAEEDLRAACGLCAEVGVASICVKPYMVPLAAELLADSAVKVSTVISFPHGACATAVKVAEARAACDVGAVELDMVVNLGLVQCGQWADVETEICAVVAAAAESGAITKVIFETGLLSDADQKIRLCQCSENAGAAFVKTSTGFGFVKQPDGTMKSTGATFDDIQLMREHCSEAVGVKASGGIRNLADARQFIKLGATRLGTSSTRSLVDEETDGSEILQTKADY
ncbi:MAG: deoxyribose-phosphate aldolase [Planctomycetota bacterium]|nr:deoxyribose-phosphate aldolase [Planctomycetota bacterium]